MPLQLIRQDITRMEVDAIVNAANSGLLGGGGVDGAIHRAAGPGLLAECRTLGGCATGDAKITGGYRLPCKYVIHTVGPVWRGGLLGERKKLASCYRTSLAVAKEHGCESIAFPLISSGVYGYPKDKALQVAVEEISKFLFENDMLVYIVIFDRTAYKISEKLFKDIAAYIDDTYVDEHTDPLLERRRRQLAGSDLAGLEAAAFQDREDASPDLSALLPPPLSMPAAPAPPPKGGRPAAPPAAAMPPVASAPAPRPMRSLDEALAHIDESFSEMLLRKIDERGMTDAQCYKKANVDRRLFSKIRNDKFYKPSKPTVLALALALELPPREVREMLMKAGFALSHSNKFDIIVEYFIRSGNYNVFEINEALFAFDQPLLGA